MKLILLLILAAAVPSIAAEPTTRPAILIGADLSMLASLEGMGVKYSEGGKTGDCIEIFRRNGFNCIRLRLFVEPNDKGGVVNDLAYTLALAKRAKASGATFLLDFHYSDTWADHEHQPKPRSWEGLNFDELEAQVESYTAEVMSEFKKADLLPELVQVGNEINRGMIFPDGQLVGGGADVPQNRKFLRLLKAGIRGVRSVASKEQTQVMIHIAGFDFGFFDRLIAGKVEFDVVGFSYYPEWHGGVNDLRGTLKNATRFGKPIVLAETAYAWRANPDAKSPPKMPGPVSPQGQRDFLRGVLKALRDTPKGLGYGVIYWHPESVRQPGTGKAWAGGSNALFDDDGNTLPAMSFPR